MVANFLSKVLIAHVQVVTYNKIGITLPAEINLKKKKKKKQYLYAISEGVMVGAISHRHLYKRKFKILFLMGIVDYPNLQSILYCKCCRCCFQERLVIGRIISLWQKMNSLTEQYKNNYMQNMSLFTRYNTTSLKILIIALE